jgi:hypothetical protein
MPVVKDGNRPARRSGYGVAADDDVRMEAVTDVATGGAGSLPTPILGTTATGPSTRVRPRVTDGGGGKAGDHDGDTGEGAEHVECGHLLAVFTLSIVRRVILLICWKSLCPSLGV